MRFLSGLMFGASVVLVASLFFAKPLPASDSDLKQTEAPGQQPRLDTALRPIATVEKPAPAAKEPAAKEPAAEEPAAQRAAQETTKQPATEISEAESPVPTKAVIAELTDTPATEPAVASQTSGRSKQQPQTDGSPPEALASAPAEENQPNESMTAAVPDNEAPLAIEPTTVSVWQPFHSEVSANGFAKRLSLQLGYPFSVIKTGPAKYHVVFSYRAESERELLSAQLATLTGVTPQ